MRSSRVKLAENHLNIKHLITVTKRSAAHAWSTNIAPTSEMLITLEKVCLILHPSSRGGARLYFLQGAGLLSSLAPFAYAVKRSDTQRQRLTFEFRADGRGVFAASLPTPSSQ